MNALLMFALALGLALPASAVVHQNRGRVPQLITATMENSSGLNLPADVLNETLGSTVAFAAVLESSTRLVMPKVADLPSLERFLPGCEAHVREVIATVDLHYTDNSLQLALEQQCSLDKQFPEVHEDGYSHADACKKGAKLLVQARRLELEEGSLKGYMNFCVEYYAHVGGTMAEVKDSSVLPDLKRPGINFDWNLPWKWILLFIVLAILVLLIVAVLYRVRAWFRGSVTVVISSAKGLRDADTIGLGKSDPYCEVSIPGKYFSKCKTKVIKNTCDPVWEEAVVVKDYEPGDALQFKVMDRDPWRRKDDFLGKALLEGSRFRKDGFEGELDLVDTETRGRHRPKLHIKVIAPQKK